MRMTIGKKLTFSFLGLAILVLLSGIVGIIVLDKASKSADTVAKEKAPVQYAVMNAALSVDKIQKLLLQYSAANTNLSDLEASLTTNLNEFDMWTNMLELGTESAEFKDSVYGGVYTENNLSVITPMGSGEIIEVIDKIHQESATLRKNVADLVKAHNEYVSYSVTTQNGVNFPLPVFLNIAQIDQIKWTRQLKDAVAIETTFTGITEPEKGLMGEWLFSYQVGNEKLTALINKLTKQHKKLRALAVKINGKESGKDKLRLFNRGIGVGSKIDRYFNELDTLSVSIYKELETSQENSHHAVTGSADVINAELKGLISNAEQEMQAALKSSEAVKKNGTTVLLVLTVAAVIIAVFMGSLMSRYLAKRISELAGITKKVAAGDLKEKVTLTSSDELGDLGNDTNSMIDNLREIIGQVGSYSTSLANSAGNLAGVSKDLDNNSLDLGSKSTAAAEATKTMASSMLDISTIANDSMERVQSVALATEEMSATINEIAENTEQARSITARAVVTVEDTSSKINELSDAAREIGEVADVIVNIADQTNLLSLNATIEAARAGEAGKGFAVVANEVKELASQTNQATEDIRQKIQAIQQSSEMTITEITEISKIINDINAIVVVIAGAVEEQAVTTTQITEDVASVSHGIENMNQNVQSGTEVADSVSQDIDVVNATSSDVQNGSSQINNSAEELEKLAGDLQTLVGKFSL